MQEAVKILLLAAILAVLMVGQRSGSGRFTLVNQNNETLMVDTATGRVWFFQRFAEGKKPEIISVDFPQERIRSAKVGEERR